MKAIIISGFLFDLSDNINPFLDKDTDLYIHTWNSSENLRWINKARRLKKYVNNFEIHIEDKKFDNKLFSYIYSTYKVVNNIKDIDQYEYIIKFKPNLDAIRIKYRLCLQESFNKAKVQTRPLLSDKNIDDCFFGSIYYKTLDERLFTGFPKSFRKVFIMPENEFINKSIKLNNKLLEKYKDYEGSIFWTELIESSGVKIIQDLNLKIPNNKNFNNKVGY